jgi:opacity protein-like surface antigen
MTRRIIAAALLAAVVAVAAVAATSASAQRGSTSASAANATLVADLAQARIATAKYANNLARAKADGYGIITQMIPNMGYHYLNGKITGFDVRKPPILVYERSGNSWTLGAIEWVFTSKPAKPPLPGAKYGSFGAGCHYKDGTFVPATQQSDCPTTNPDTGAAFNFWHPLLITLHVWLWYPNPSGLFASTNPLVAPFNEG